MLVELRHRSLEVWQLSRRLVKDVYEITYSFPKRETYGLSAHIRKTSVSVISNIAEGASRRSLKERHRFFEIARSSLVELDTQLQIAEDLDYIKPDKIEDLTDRMRSVFKMLSVMLQRRND